MYVSAPRCLGYLHAGSYAAVWPLCRHLKLENIFGPHFPLRVLHTALDVPLHLHSLPCQRETRSAETQTQLPGFLDPGARKQFLGMMAWNRAL